MIIGMAGAARLLAASEPLPQRRLQHEQTAECCEAMAQKAEDIGALRVVHYLRRLARRLTHAGHRTWNVWGAIER